MKRALVAVALVVLSTALTVLVVEGGHALARWKRLDGSITYKAWRTWREAGRGSEDATAAPAFTRTLSYADLEALVPALADVDAGIGNSPFDVLVTREAAVNERVDGCLVQKPNLRKTMTFLRTHAFNPLDPPALFYDADRTLPPAVEALVRDYGVRPVAHTTNAHGERVTLPEVEAHAVVLVAGDSVANGAMVGDAETLASRLQARDPTRRYVNLGIGDAEAADVLCALERALPRYAGRIEAIVYVYCENDFDADLAYGTPGPVIERLETLASRAGAGNVTVVYAPFVYNTVPQVTRFRGYRGGRAPTNAAARATLREAATTAGFRHVDIADVALEEADRRGTQFAALALFVDHAHLSPYGAGRLADVLLDGRLSRSSPE